MKRLLYTALMSMATLVAYIGIHPTCWGTIHQPEVPEELLR